MAEIEPSKVPAPTTTREDTPLLASADDPQRVAASSLPDPSTYPLSHQASRPKYAISSLLEAHRLPSRRAGMLWVAELGISIWFITVWVTVLTHRAGLFTFHPIFQSLALLFFYQGILILQPTNTPASKRTGLLFHEAFQLLGSLLIIVGSSAIIYNKISHSAPHFTSWHGLLGFISVCIVLVQALFGALIGFEWSRDYILGDSVGRQLWKYHRASGYLLVFLMTLTVLTATRADWVVFVSSKWSIWVLTISPIVALIGLLSLVNVDKIIKR